MQELWNDKTKYDTWLKVELLVCKALNQLGVIPSLDFKKILLNAKFDVSRILEIEKETKHDVIAFLKAVTENLGEESKWLHYGLTSTDIVDTSFAYILYQVNTLLLKDLEELILVLEEKARLYKYTVIMGRTHGMHAEPLTFGLKLAIFVDEMRRNKERFILAMEDLRVGKISGAVGTYANIDPFVEEYVCKELNLKFAKISNQVLARDLHAHYISVLALIGASLEKFATEIRNLQRFEIYEVEEEFTSGQKGSSAMPHKRNPIGCENICGLARLLKGYMFSAYENVPLWHERDISHSSVERVIFPDATILLDFMLSRFKDIIKNLRVFEENMKNNIFKSFDLTFSQRVLLLLITKGVTRKEAYDLVQELSFKAWEEKRSFKDVLLEDKRILGVLDKEELLKCFDLAYYLRYVDIIFKRLAI